MGDNMEHFLFDNIKLMVIDNDQAFLKEARMMFSSCNYRVTTCASPLCALKILRERGAEFDLLLVEVHMQEMGGFELISTIKKEFDLQFIMISTDARLEIMKRSVELGACFFVKKPLDINTVENLWQHMLSFKKRSERERIESIGEKEFRRTGQTTSNEEEENRIGAREEDVSIPDDRSRQEDDIPTKAASKGCSECSKGKNAIEGEQEIESEDDGSSKPRKKAITWCSILEQKFLDALEILGEDAVPSKIVRLMNVEGVTRQQVASHLQKYRKKKGSNNTFTLVYCAPNIQGDNFVNQIPNYNQFGQQHGMHPTYLSNYNQQYLQGVLTQIAPIYAQTPLSFNTYPHTNMCYEGSYSGNLQLNGYATSNPTQVLQQFGTSQPQIPFTNNASANGETSTQLMTYETTNDAINYGLVANGGEKSTYESSASEVGQQYYYGSNSRQAVDDGDFGDIERFAYGDDPWLSILQDVAEGGLDLDINNI